MNELILRFWPHAEMHYRHPDGNPTSELADYKLSLRPLRHSYGHTPAREFGPLALKAARQAAGQALAAVSADDGKIGRASCRERV